jgi:hypothetical protein
MQMATDGLYPAEVIGETGQVVEQLALLSYSSAIPFRSLPAQRNEMREDTLKYGRHCPVSFRREASHIPSTTFGVFGLYRYPAKFIPQAVAYVIDHYATCTSRVIDPFAGSGTTGLTAYLYGLDSELWDLNPLLNHIVQTSLMKPIPIKAEAIVSEMQKSQADWLPEWSRLTYWYPESVFPILSKVWGYYHQLSDQTIRSLLTFPLLKATKQFSYNDPQRQKLSRSPKATRRVETLLQNNPEHRFFQLLHDEIAQVQRKLHEYHQLASQSNPSTITVRAGIDSSEYVANLPEGLYWDILITSPPYLQAQEYIRCSKLDLFWLGYTEEQIRALSKLELPYKIVEPFEVRSRTYNTVRETISEPHLIRMYEQYFYSVLRTLTLLSERIRDTLALFVGQATVRGRRVPIDTIFAEHFCALGWRHEVTYIDKIEARVMFRSRVNPATGIEDQRMPTEHMVILRR